MTSSYVFYLFFKVTLDALFRVISFPHKVQFEMPSNGFCISIVFIFELWKKFEFGRKELVRLPREREMLAWRIGKVCRTWLADTLENLREVVKSTLMQDSQSLVRAHRESRGMVNGMTILVWMEHKSCVPFAFLLFAQT